MDKDLNVRLDIIKLFKESIGKTFFDINHSNIFFDPPPRAMKITTTTKKTIGAVLIFSLFPRPEAPAYTD